MKKNVVMILSGGMDSGVLISELNKFSRVHALTFDYGSNHSLREIEAAKKLANLYADAHHLIQLPFIKDLFKSSLLSGASAVPEGHYADNAMRSTVVPFRNAIMLSIAVGYAESIGAKSVYLGNHRGDHYVYPDCRPEFISSFKKSAECGTYAGIIIESPYCSLTKREIGLVGHANNFDFSITYSCYKGLEKHCGKCGACTERKEALNGFDTTQYLE